MGDAAWIHALGDGGEHSLADGCSTARSMSRRSLWVVRFGAVAGVRPHFPVRSYLELRWAARPWLGKSFLGATQPLICWAVWDLGVRASMPGQVTHVSLR